MSDRLTIQDGAVEAFLGRLLVRAGECVPDCTDILLSRRDGVCIVVYQGKTFRPQEREVIEDDTGYFRFEKLVTLRDGEFEEWGERFFSFEVDSIRLYIRCTFRDREALGDGAGIGFMLRVCRQSPPRK